MHNIVGTIMSKRMNPPPHDLLWAHEEEKRRISQEIHDTLSQSLAILKMHVQQALQDGNLQQKGYALVDEIQALIDQSRTIAFDLHGDALKHRDLLAAIKDYAEKITQQFPVTLHVSGNTSGKNLYPYPDSLHLFRIVQESVTNSIKHSKASDISIDVTHVDPASIFTITDNGMGFDTDGVEIIKNSNHLGLQILRDRSRAIGADLQIKSSIGRGTVVTIRYKHKKEEVL